MTNSQRTKGASGEREWCKLLAEHGFSEPKRLLGQARDGGGDVPTPPILWEVKRHAKFAIYKFFKQALAGLVLQKGCRHAAVAIRADNEDWLVVMSARDLLPILYRDLERK